MNFSVTKFAINQLNRGYNQQDKVLRYLILKWRLCKSHMHQPHIIHQRLCNRICNTNTCLFILPEYLAHSDSLSSDSTFMGDAIISEGLFFLGKNSLFFRWSDLCLIFICTDLC
uniref:Uncharacterized protein n=1 Tax=Cacopsylla melanoneura TaxID=428564 RepID=A0A8D9EGI6_9HEMI